MSSSREQDDSSYKQRHLKRATVEKMRINHLDGKMVHAARNSFVGPGVMRRYVAARRFGREQV